MDTLEPMLQGGPLGWAPPPTPRRPPRPPWVVPVVVVVVAVVALIAGELKTVPYFSIAPGSAESVAPLIQLPKGQAAPGGRGTILLTTVQLGPVRALEWALDHLRPDVQLVRREQILGTTPPGKLQQQNQQEMTDSIQAAVVVALRRLGKTVTESGTGALVDEVGDGTPAAGRLKAGETIVAVDGQSTRLASDAVAIIHQHKPGDSVALTVDPGAGQATRTEVIGLIAHQTVQPQTSCAAPPATTTTAFLGVGLETRAAKYDMPVAVSINSGGIGGPSAGVAFTLGIISALTSGDLTAGHRVAATGVINADGTIGDVGGVPQKTIAVRHAGAEVFLVPCGEYQDAKKKAGKHLRVIAVATLEQALTAVHTVGGNIEALPPPPSTLLR